MPALCFLYSELWASASLNAFVGSLDVIVFLIILNACLIVDWGAGVIIETTSIPHDVAYLISSYWFFYVLNAIAYSCSDFIKAAASAVSAGLTSIMWDWQPVNICLIRCGLVAHGILSYTELCLPYAIGWMWILYLRSAAGPDRFLEDTLLLLRLDEGI